MSDLTAEQWEDSVIQNIGANLKKIRKDKNLTAQQIADRCKEVGYYIPRTMLTKLEIGQKKNITVTQLIAIATALEVAPIELIYNPGGGQINYLPNEILKYEILGIHRFIGDKTFSEEAVIGDKPTLKSDPDSTEESYLELIKSCLSKTMYIKALTYDINKNRELLFMLSTDTTDEETVTLLLEETVGDTMMQNPQLRKSYLIKQIEEAVKTNEIVVRHNLVFLRETLASLRDLGHQIPPFVPKWILDKLEEQNPSEVQPMTSIWPHLKGFHHG